MGNEQQKDSASPSELSIELPPDHRHLKQLLRLKNDKRANKPTVTGYIIEDPVLILEILKAHNTKKNDRTRLDGALVKFGTDKSLRLLEALGERSLPSDEEVRNHYEGLRWRARRIALAADSLAQYTFKEHQEDATLVSMMATIGQMLACIHLEEKYLKLLEKYSGEDLEREMIKRYDFDLRSTRNNFLVEHGYPQDLMFVIDEDLTSSSRITFILCSILQAAVCLVDAFESDQWSRFSSGHPLPENYPVTKLGMSRSMQSMVLQHCYDHLLENRKKQLEDADCDHAPAEQEEQEEQASIPEPPSLQTNDQEFVAPPVVREPLPLDLNILLVDDVPSARRIVRRLLSRLGFKNIVEAANGQTAIDAIQTNPIELVISDLRLGDMIGTEILKQVRESSDFGDLGFIFISSDVDGIDLSFARSDELTTYLLKPFSTKQLEESISHVLFHEEDNSFG